MVPFRWSRRDEGRTEVGPPPPPGGSAMAPGKPNPLSAANFGSEMREVAQIIGQTIVPQIVVGSPSPQVEPSAIAKSYRSLPFRPDVVIDGWSTEAMTIRGVSQRGHLHRYNGAPRQDDFACHHLPDGRVVVLVADGVSGAPQSHIGASVATRYAAEWMHSNLGDDVADTDWLTLFKSTAWAMNERAETLLRLKEPDAARTEEEFATTLMCAVIEPREGRALRAHLVGVGDSAAWLLSLGWFIAVLGGKTVALSGVASSAVVGLPRVPTEVTPVVVDIAEDEVLLIATDGIGDPLGTGQGAVGNLLREILTRPSTPSLIEFAHAVDFSRETFDDDRTLVAVWPRRSDA